MKFRGCVVSVGLAALVASGSPSARAAEPPAGAVRLAPVQATPASAAPQTPPILPLSEVRPGMAGIAWTVFRGTRPEPFNVRVVSVLRNFIPKQDIILVRAEDPRVEFSGIAAGMSGSPVYVDGKLMGAIAYAWAFSKEPLAGVTPIEDMLAERQRPRRPDEPGRAVAAPGLALPGATARGDVAGDVTGPAAAPAPASRPPEADLRPAVVPLAIAGFGDGAAAYLAEALRPMGLVPTRGGGGGPAARASVPADALVPGAPVGVELIRGDMSAVAMGTLTHVEGKTVVAFGHRMFGQGQVKLPMVLGEIHSFMPSVASSFKLASPLGEIGAVIQDRTACIVGSLGERAPMTPVTLSVRVPGQTERVFRAEIARHELLMPALTGAVIMNGVAHVVPDPTDMTIVTRARFQVSGEKPFSLDERVWSNDGFSPRVLGAGRVLNAMVSVLQNPFRSVQIEQIDVEVEVAFRKDVVDIVAVAAPGDALRPGATVPVRVTLRPFAGREFVEIVPISVPATLAGRQVTLEVAAGPLAPMDLPRPESLADQIANLQRYHDGFSLVASLGTTDDGVALRGRLIPDLPGAALDTLRPARATRRADGYRVQRRTVAPLGRPVRGKQTIVLVVEDHDVSR